MKKNTRLLVLMGLVAILCLVFIPRVVAANSTATPAASVDQDGPPWFDVGWLYRKPVTIENEGSSIPWYQVLVKLDSGNFDFSRAQAGGADIRFSHSDGTTLLNFWIESWDSAAHLAYLWVRVPGIAPGETTIYIYYGNPVAGFASSGMSTFESFEDDWDLFHGNANLLTGLASQVHAGNTPIPFDWITLSGVPEAASGILSLDDGVGIKSSQPYLYTAMGMRANFGLGNGGEWGGYINGSSGQHTMVGDLSSDPGDLFLIDSRDGLETVIFPRIGDVDWHGNFHVYEVRWNTLHSKGEIDHGASFANSTQPAQVPNTSLPVTLYSYPGAGATLQVDWVYIRLYRDPEPVVSVGPQQGLVELSIEMTDTPDPIRTDQHLTYTLVVSNDGSIDAPGVAVTDTLPASVEFWSVTTSQGSCEPGSTIHCDLDILDIGSSALITIVVTTEADGVITNLATVGSPGFELNLNDNTAEETTLVDSLPPVVNWVKPVTNGGVFHAWGGWVTLQASATDNDQVAWVQYRLWDHLNNEWVTVGTDTTSPYQVPFDSDILEVDELYQMFVMASDRAGNVSNPYNPLQVIYIAREIPAFMPIISK